MTHPQPVIDRIIALAASGLSRAVIADQVGPTRSVVCGLLWRRGEKPKGVRPKLSTQRSKLSGFGC
jgi:hypothetical protein